MLLIFNKTLSILSKFHVKMYISLKCSFVYLSLVPVDVPPNTRLPALHMPQTTQITILSRNCYCNINSLLLHVLSITQQFLQPCVAQNFLRIIKISVNIQYTIFSNYLRLIFLIIQVQEKKKAHYQVLRYHYLTSSFWLHWLSQLKHKFFLEWVYF